MQIDWEKSEWQCVRMVIDQLINQIVELSKQIQDSRRKYGEVSSSISDKNRLISMLQNGIAMYKKKQMILDTYSEKLRDMLIEHGVSEDVLDDILDDITCEYDGRDE